MGVKPFEIDNLGDRGFASDLAIIHVLRNRSFWEDFQTAPLFNLSVSASLAASSAVTTVRPLECNI